MMLSNLLRDFSNGAMLEAAVVEQASIGLLTHFGLTERFGWMAIKEQIETAAARRVYPGKTKGDVAIHWVDLANKGKLHIQVNAHGSLEISG
jgi:hypothetical protein